MEKWILEDKSKVLIKTGSLKQGKNKFKAVISLLSFFWNYANFRHFFTTYIGSLLLFSLSFCNPILLLLSFNEKFKHFIPTKSQYSKL